MLEIDRYAYINRLSHIHPAEKLGLALVTLVICLVFSSSITSFLVILFMAGLVIVLARIPILFYLKLMLIPMAFLVVGVLAVGLAFAKDPSCFLWGLEIGCYMLGVTTRSLGMAGELFLRSLAAVSCLYFLSLTTPVVEIFAVLKKLRVPPLFIELMSLVYRYIFVLLGTARKIYIAQASRWGYATLKTSYFSLGQLVSNLFAKSYYSSQMLYTALAARGYRGDLNVLEKSYALSRKRLLLIITVELGLLVISLYFSGGVGH